jgi:hypothetical protein
MKCVFNIWDGFSSNIPVCISQYGIYFSYREKMTNLAK